MRSNMPPQAYISEDWFNRERDLLFKPLWQFIGLKMMLSQNNAFITRRLFGVPIVVQNFDGQLRAFENLCLHRSMPLQTEAHGVRSLVCAYHGWRHGSEGEAAKIPFEDELYRFPEKERECLRLRRFALTCVGNLVFVNLSPDPMPIENQYNEFFLKSLKSVSESFDSEVMLTTYQGKFNWKLAYENLRDGLHPRYLHAGSLYQEVKFQAKIHEEGLEIKKRYDETGVANRDEALSLMRNFSAGGLDAPRESMPRFSWHDNVERYKNKDWYYNWLAFPNLHIASGTGGYSFIIEHHIPVSANQTEFMVHYVTAKKKRPYSSSAAVLHAHMMGAETVLREDISVMEKIQDTLHPDAPHAQLGDFDAGVNGLIESWYLDVMGGKIAL